MNHGDKLLPWLALKNVYGVGNLLFKRLLDRFESPQNILNAPYEMLARVEGITKRVANAIRACKIQDRFKKELDLVFRRGYRIITMNDTEYPPLLREIADPPPYLYVNGILENSIRNIAVVGSRGATRYGLLTSRRLCGDLVSRKMTVVSGMARGIDTAAHVGTLEAGGNTVAVLGSGLDRIYPPENRGLFHAIAKNGAVITEFSMGMAPEAHHFPIRNRIISGMSLGTVVVEAATRSGSLITARMAAEQNREVFAVPGDIHSMKSTGTHNLIKQGAKLVGNAGDIMDELSGMLRDTREPDEHGPARPPARLPKLDPEESRVMNALGSYPVHIDEIVRKITMEPGKLFSILLQLELKGLVEQTPGKMFSSTVEVGDR